MSKLIRLMLVAALAALWIVSGSVSAQSPNVYTSLVVSDITSGAPVIGGFFTTPVSASVTNDSRGTPTPIQGIEAYIGFDPDIVNVVDFDSNPTNGVQVEIKTGFFTSIQTGINRVETPCPPPSSAPACVHIAISQISGGVTNGSGLIARIRWVGRAAGAAGISVEASSVMSDPDGMSVIINNRSAPSIQILSPGAITGTVTRQGRTPSMPPDGHAHTSVTAYNLSGGLVAGPVETDRYGIFVSPLQVPVGGTYVVVASYPGYLSARKSPVYVVGATVDIDSTQLRGGDANSDNCVNIFDLVTIASWFSQSSPPAPPAVDINDDGFVSIFDLTIAASNFLRCGSTAW
ncbi:MAG TPA: hypothetical protein VJG32_09630 [Anaerolineae bacterium]|nr:hypothetical protein [Anaerolineae bacterium]